MVLNPTGPTPVATQEEGPCRLKREYCNEYDEQSIEQSEKKQNDTCAERQGFAKLVEECRAGYRTYDQGMCGDFCFPLAFDKKNSFGSLGVDFTLYFLYMAICWNEARGDHYCGTVMYRKDDKQSRCLPHQCDCCKAAFHTRFGVVIEVRLRRPSSARPTSVWLYLRAAGPAAVPTDGMAIQRTQDKIDPASPHDLYVLYDTLLSSNPSIKRMSSAGHCQQK